MRKILPMVLFGGLLLSIFGWILSRNLRPEPLTLTNSNRQEDLFQNGIYLLEENNQQNDLYLLQNRSLQKLTPTPNSNEYSLYHSNDKNRAVLITRDLDFYTLWLLEKETGEKKLITVTPAPPLEIKFSPHSNWLLYQQENNRAYDLYLLDLTNSLTYRLAEKITTAFWTDSDQQIMFQEENNDQLFLITINSNGQPEEKKEIITDNISSARFWQQNIYGLRLGSNGWAIVKTNIRGENQREILSLGWREDDPPPHDMTVMNEQEFLLKRIQSSQNNIDELWQVSQSTATLQLLQTHAKNLLHDNTSIVTQTDENTFLILDTITKESETLTFTEKLTLAQTSKPDSNIQHSSNLLYQKSTNSNGDGLPDTVSIYADGTKFEWILENDGESLYQAAGDEYPLLIQIEKRNGDFFPSYLLLFHNMAKNHYIHWNGRSYEQLAPDL